MDSSFKSQFSDYSAFHSHMEDRHLASRIRIHTALKQRLESFSDEGLIKLLESATILHDGIGGVAGFVELDGKPVFFKRVALTDKEMHPQNRGSTANLYNLPSYFQYGVGSSGFGTERELAAHKMTTKWALDGECQNFPLLYHSRTLARPTPQAPTVEESKKFEEFITYWNSSEEIRDRCKSIRETSFTTVLFLENIPTTVAKWLKEKVRTGGESAESALAMVESSLKATSAFMKAHQLLHFDAHFHNILTDGERLYFTDFGLSTSSKFELSDDEIKFFEQNEDYDKYYTMTKLANIVRYLFEKDEAESVLKEYATGKGMRAIDPAVATILTRYAPVAIVMNTFLEALRTDKNTPFPKEELEKASANITC